MRARVGPHRGRALARVAEKEKETDKNTYLQTCTPSRVHARAHIQHTHTQTHTGPSFGGEATQKTFYDVLVAFIRPDFVREYVRLAHVSYRHVLRNAAVCVNNSLSLLVYDALSY